MKCRGGFVSNSSSTSFIIEDPTISVAAVRVWLEEFEQALDSLGLLSKRAKPMFEDPFIADRDGNPFTGWRAGKTGNLHGLHLVRKGSLVLDDNAREDNSCPFALHDLLHEKFCQWGTRVTIYRVH
jgi:hypothetical protein